jgi:toxin-antitoxin system PIN domain toxin
MKRESTDLLLLDINVLLAVAWPNHQFHGSAIRRLSRPRQHWATCALTQLGFIRLSSNPAVVSRAVTPAQAAELLSQLIRDRLHTYLALSSPAENPMTFGALLGHRQVTDAYLVAAAREHGARFLTFDSRLRELGDVEVLI